MTVRIAIIGAGLMGADHAHVAPVVMEPETADGQLENIEVNDNAVCGYDTRAELVGQNGAIAMNGVAYTRTDLKLASSTCYDADWRARYAEAYRQQDRDFLRFVKTGRFPGIAAGSWDGYCAAVVAEAGVKALNEGRKTPIEMMEKPEFYR